MLQEKRTMVWSDGNCGFYSGKLRLPRFVIGITLLLIGPIWLSVASKKATVFSAKKGFQKYWLSLLPIVIFPCQERARNDRRWMGKQSFFLVDSKEDQETTSKQQQFTHCFQSTKDITGGLRKSVCELKVRRLKNLIRNHRSSTTD